MWVNLSKGETEDKDTGERFSARPLPDFMREIVEAGGWWNMPRRKGWLNKRYSEVVINMKSNNLKKGGIRLETNRG